MFIPRNPSWNGEETVAVTQACYDHPVADEPADGGGTTIAGLNALDEHRFKFALSQAVLAAARRSKELAD